MRVRALLMGVILFCLCIPILLWFEGQLEGEEPIQIPEMKIVTEIPERYNPNVGVLLEDFQNGRITIDEVIQILILWNGKGEYIPAYDLDVQGDHVLVDKDQRDRIEEYKKSIFKKR